jgi:hypothetical protein
MKIPRFIPLAFYVQTLLVIMTPSYPAGARLDDGAHLPIIDELHPELTNKIQVLIKNGACPEEVKLFVRRLPIRKPPRIILKLTENLPTWKTEPLVNFLHADLDTIPRERYNAATKMVWRGWDAFARIGKRVGAHWSKTHSLRDVSIQALILIAYEPNLNSQKWIAAHVYHGHQIDDWADRLRLEENLKIDFSDILNFSDHALLHLDGSGELHDVHEALFAQLLEEMNFPHQYVDQAKADIYSFGIRRLIRGGRIFGLPPAERDADLMRDRDDVISRLQPNSPLKDLLMNVSLNFIGQSIKPSLEIVDPFRWGAYSFEMMIWGDLLFGPMVDVHNSVVEEHGVIISGQETIRSLSLTAAGIKKLPPEMKRKILLPLPAAIEAFRTVLANTHLLEVYMNIIRDPEIEPYLPVDAKGLDRLAAKMVNEKLLQRH